jgi:hypothetical protein
MSLGNAAVAVDDETGTDTGVVGCGVVASVLSDDVKVNIQMK